MGKTIDNSGIFRPGMLLRYVLCLLMLVAPFIRGLYAEQYYLPFIILFSLLFVLFLFEQVKTRETGFFNYPLDWAMLALFAAYLLSLFTAIHIRSAIIAAMTFSMYVMVFWSCYRVARHDKGIHFLFTTFYLAGIGVGIFGLLVYCGLIHYSHAGPFDRIGSTIEYANTLGIYMAAILMIGWSFILTNQRLSVRAAVAGGNFLLFTAMLGSLSRGTWILYPFAILAFILLVAQGKRLYASGVWMVSFIVGLLMGRFFLNITSSSRGIIYIILGLILAAGAQVGFEYIYRWLDQNHKITRRNILIMAVSAGILVLLGAGMLYFHAGNSPSTNTLITRLTSLNLGDQNIQLRLEFNRDALKIIKDHPLTGVGGGGWEALYHSYASHLYWSNQAHNYFFQTWVETGTLGFLALLAIWAVFLHFLWKYRSRDNNDSNVSIIIWGGSVAVFLLCVHSIMDFDLSIPAVAFLLFGLLGAIKGQVLSSPAAAVSTQDLSQKKRRQKAQPFYFKRGVVVSLVLGTVYSLVLIVGSGFFWNADMEFNQAQTVVNKDPSQSLTLLAKSLNTDPWNASHWVWAATLMADQYSQTRDSQAYQRTLAFNQKAIGLEPYNLDLLNKANLNYLNIGAYDQAVNVAQSIIRVNPWQTDAYETLAHNEVLAGIQYLESGKLDKARSYWQESLKVKDIVPSQLDEPAVGLNFTSGQANLLLGERGLGESLLRTMLTLTGADRNGKVSEDRKAQIDYFQVHARAWLIASLVASGNSAEAQALLDQAPPKYQASIKAEAEQVQTWLKKLMVN